MADRFTVFVRDDECCRKQDSSTRLVLYALASRADAKGYCWPSIDQLIIDTGLSRATIFRSLRNVRELLTIDTPGFKHSNSYIFPYQRNVNKVSASVDKSGKTVDNSANQESHTETDSLTVRPRQSHSETGGGLTVRPEEYNRRIQEDSLSLTLSHEAKNQSHSKTPVDKSVGYDGKTKPRTAAHIKRITEWCRAAYLDEQHVKEFLRINRLAGWRNVSEAYTVMELIADFALKWEKDYPDEYACNRERMIREAQQKGGRK